MTLTHVDGKAIIERQPARYTENNRPSHQVAVGTVIGTAEELLLEDGTVIFHCAHKNDPDCEYVNVNVNSITSHQRTHSDRMVAKRANEDAEKARQEAATLQAELDERRRRKSEGGVKAAATKAAKKLQTPVEVGGAGRRSVVGTPSKSVVGDPELARRAQQVIIAYNALQDAHDQFQNVFLGYMRAAQNVSETVTIDPEILEKAKKYDALKGMLA